VPPDAQFSASRLLESLVRGDVTPPVETVTVSAVFLTAPTLCAHRETMETVFSYSFYTDYINPFSANISYFIVSIVSISLKPLILLCFLWQQYWKQFDFQLFPCFHKARFVTIL
jgi:hypothetical protein